MLNTNSMVSEPKLLHTGECKINGICFQVSVFQSPNAETLLKQKCDPSFFSAQKRNISAVIM